MVPFLGQAPPPVSSTMRPSTILIALMVAHQALEHLGHPLGVLGVEVAGRFVGEQDRRIVGKIADQNLKFARRLAKYAYIVENGIIRRQGAREALLEDDETVRKDLAA